MAKIWDRRAERLQADALVCTDVAGWLEQVIAMTGHTVESVSR